MLDSIKRRKQEPLFIEYPASSIEYQLANLGRVE